MSKKLIFSALAAAGLAIALATPAYAHVTVQPGAVNQGDDDAVFAFRVPNEDPAAGTVKLEVQLPADHPIAAVRTEAVPGWSAQIVRDAKSVHQIVWTAQPGVRIGPNQFQDFVVSAQPLPDNTDQLVMPTTQTYDNGKVVKWDAPPAPEGAPEPEHPAPTLELQPASDSAGGHQHGDSAAPSVSSQSAPESAATSDATARWLGGAGLLVGALGLGLGAGALLRGRRGGSA